MTDISRKLSTGEREILKNQRLIMRALVAIDRQSAVSEQIMRRLVEMDRDWEFVATAEERVIPYDPSRS